MKRFIGDTERELFDERHKSVADHIADAGKMVECHCAAPSCQCHRMGLTQEEEAKHAATT